MRAAISTALGLAVSRGLPLVGIGTLDVLAYQAFLAQADRRAEDGTLLLSIMPAGRGEFYYATYAPRQAVEGAGSWASKARRDGPAVATAEQRQDMMKALASTPVIVCGTLTADLMSMVREAGGER